MQSWQREHIESNLPYLILHTSCNVHLLASLCSQRVISVEDKDEIESHRTSHEKAYTLYGILLNRTGGYDALLQALIETKQTGPRRILRQRLGASLLATKNSIEYDENYVLGKGAHAVVYKGRFASRDVAVKRSRGSSNAINELKILKGLPAHSNIVQFLAAEEELEYHLVAFELCDGSLEDCIQDKSFPLEKREVLRQVTVGLGFLHANNIIHRDLKPANVLFVHTSQNTAQMKISGYGLSIKLNEYRQSYTATSLSPVGTLPWTPPEILRFFYEDITSDMQYPRWTIQSDIFPLGCIFCYVLTEGTHPFGTAFRVCINILKGRYALPDDAVGVMKLFRSVIEKMIRTDPSGRPSCEEILLDKCFVNTGTVQSSRHGAISNLKAPYSNPEALLKGLEETRQTGPHGFLYRRRYPKTDFSTQPEEKFARLNTDINLVQVGVQWYLCPIQDKNDSRMVDLGNKKIDEIVQILKDCLLQYETEVVTNMRETKLQAARTNIPRVQFADTDVPFPDDEYKLPPTESKGLVLIINILLFDYQPQRLDANLDTLALTTIFTSLGYQIYSCEVASIHWTKKTFFDIVEAFKRECCEQTVDSFGVFLGSHGSLGYLHLFAENDKVYLNDAIETLCTRKDASRHPNWDEIPKMFFLQVCREEEDSPAVNEDVAKTCLISFACRRGQRAHRDNRGSVYVKHLVHNLANFASREDLLRILERTREDVKSEMMREASTVQEPEHYGYNFKKLYFNMVSSAN